MAFSRYVNKAQWRNTPRIPDHKHYQQIFDNDPAEGKVYDFTRVKRGKKPKAVSNER